MSLRLRVMVSILSALALSLVLGGGLAVWHAARSVASEMQAALEVGDHTIRNAIDHLSESPDPGAELYRLVETFDGDRHVLVVLLDEAGRPIQVSSPEPPRHLVPEWFVHLLGVAPQLEQIPLQHLHGTIVLQTDLRNETGEIWDEFGDTLDIIGLFSLSSLIVVSWSVSRGLRPLTRLIEGFERVGNGEYGVRLEPKGAAELTRLVDSFNLMVERLAVLEERNHRLHEQLSNLQEEERAELARDLHDEIGPFLFAVSVDIAAIPALSETGQHAQLVERTGAIRDAVAHLQKQVRSLLGRLRPVGHLDFGLAHAVEELAAFWRRCYPEVTIDVAITVPSDALAEPLAGTIYRLVQEGLSNAVRHGHPSRIDVAIEPAPSGEILVTVRDDGTGLAEPSGRKGFGLVGMAERVAQLGGAVEVTNLTGGRGALLSARLPRDTALA
ncbi:MAG TPA: histidine kinase [Aliidongia sp.]|nr:histidine kinase [Aliidongia sp.]